MQPAGLACGLHFSLYNKGMSRYLTIAYVRDEMQDRTPADNELEQDLFFTDKEILHAMESAANMYNGLAPLGVDVVSARSLPAMGTNVFIDAVVISLYKQAEHKLARNLVSSLTGDAPMDIEKTRLQAFQVIRKEMEQAWRAEAKDRKITINRNRCWGFV